MIAWGLGAPMFAFLIISGGALNLWRWLAPSLVAGTFTSNDWVWPLGNIAGALLAVAFFKMELHYGLGGAKRGRRGRGGRGGDACVDMCGRGCGDECE